MRVGHRPSLDSNQTMAQGGWPLRGERRDPYYQRRPAKPRKSLSVGVSCKRRVTQWVKNGRSTGVHHHLQVINDGAHPPTLRSVGKPEFVKLPTIFVILEPQK